MSGVRTLIVVSLACDPKSIELRVADMVTDRHQLTVYPVMDRHRGHQDTHF